MKNSQKEVIEKLAKKFVEYNNAQKQQNNTNQNNYNKPVTNDLRKKLVAAPTYSGKVEYIWDKENNRITIYFGKNGNGITDELITIGEFLKRLSEKSYIYLEDAFFDSLDDVYKFDVNYIYK